MRQQQQQTQPQQQQQQIIPQPIAPPIPTPTSNTSGSSMKLLLNQQIQNKQLQNQIHQLQAMQQKVVEHQAQVMSVLNQQQQQQQQQQIIVQPAQYSPTSSTGFGTSLENVTQPQISPPSPPIITEVGSLTSNNLTSNNVAEDVFEVIMQQQNGELFDIDPKTCV